MADSKDDEIRELRERLARLETSQPVDVPPAPPAKRKGGCANAIVAVLVLFALFVIVGTCSEGSNPTTGSSGTITASTPAWVPPEGFDRHSTSTGGYVGVQWEKPTRAECRGSGVTCFAVNVVSEADCSRNFYMSITLLDAGGRNIGWTNDTAQGVRAGDQVRLVFDTYENGVKSAQVADVSCY